MNVSNASSDAVAGTAKSTSKSKKTASNTTKKDAGECSLLLPLLLLEHTALYLCSIAPLMSYSITDGFSKL
jgi:hypothetical protein